jgi:hypothetical protein
MNGLLTWLLTYAIHSTVLLGIAWIVTRRFHLEPGASDLLWKVALLASLVTGTIQSRLELRTAAAMTLPSAALPRVAPTPITEPATPVLDAGKPDAGQVREPASRTPTRAPSLPLVLVLLWGFVALASSLYYVARRLILVGRLADRRGGAQRRARRDARRAATLQRLSPARAPDDGADDLEPRGARSL